MSSHEEQQELDRQAALYCPSRVKLTYGIVIWPAVGPDGDMPKECREIFRAAVKVPKSVVDSLKT